MGTTSNFFGGGGSPLPEPEWLFQKSSYTYTFPYDGTVIVHVVGAGGSGACQYNQYGATGGGAGGYCRKEFSVTSSTTATVTTGTGGLYVGQGSSQVGGQAGSATTFVLGSDTLTANGGGGGQQFGSTTAVGAGGTASGGDVNYTGGDSGARGAAYTDRPVATGGGAVNLFNLNTDGGSATNGARLAATGGGGVGGKGGDIDNNDYYQATGGGGSAGPAGDLRNLVNSGNTTSPGGAAGSRLFRFTGPLLDGKGGTPIVFFYNTIGHGFFSPTETIGMGAGSGGIVSNTDQNNPHAMFAQSAGIFGGGGGAYVGARYGGSAGDAVIGGGGGACCFYESTTSSIVRRSGRGGDGVVIIEYIER